eukprot:TRINITY_DN20421_c0_g1_i2.p1 TRINITY_DN20421_c0_g1~~TRINITY_DN20421_c0_g1_i2.p1  ORF type:complete len:577 (+),score=110.21 TRINITY_DN20421_c0_g1_i2:114-1844(+)
MASDADVSASASCSSSSAAAEDNPLVLAQRGEFNKALSELARVPNGWVAADEQGYTVLHWAALQGHAETLETGLVAGAAVDAAAKNLQTPLMWAVIRNRYEAARVLLGAGANVRLRDSYGASPLTLAVQHGNYKMILLIMANCKREQLAFVVDEKGCSAMHWAAYKGDLTSIRLLDYFEMDLNAVDNEKKTPMHRAASSRQIAAIEVLLELGASPWLLDSEGKSVLDVASDAGCGENRRLAMLMRKCGGDRPSTSKSVPSEGVLVIQDGSIDCEAGKLDSSAVSLQKPRRPRKPGSRSFPAAPLFWLMSVSAASYSYLTEARPLVVDQRPFLCAFFELGVVASLALFMIVNRLNPGIVSARMRGASGVEDIMRAMSLTAPVGTTVPDFERLCTSTWVMKGPRTKYCTQTGACVEEFDHFCGWLNVAIGRGNHRPFIFLAAIELFTQLCHLAICLAAMGNVVQKDSFFDWLSFIYWEHPLVMALIILQFVTSPMILMLLLQHLRMIGINMTTNEMINAFRYKHFWVETQTSSGQSRKTFRNPFNKGNPWLNCVDFWWSRRRGEFGSGAKVERDVLPV